MRDLTKFFIGALLVCASSFVFGTTTIKGKVTDADKEPVIGANITIKGTTEGTVTDIEGMYELSTEQATPFTLVISMVGMATVEQEVTGNMDALDFEMAEETGILNDVVVSASRVEEKILESPVTIEKMDQKTIKQASSADYYDDLAKLKGVQTINGSMTLTSINTRGFGGISNTRFVQLMDGMDNAAPLLNFPSGNVVGIGELDIANMELVPGAASALYGPNAFNGILMMNSKNPFDYPGLSVQAKGGFAQANNGYGVKPLGSFAMRVAHVWKKNEADYVAFKANFSVFKGTDWYANDYTTERVFPGNVPGDPDFDGMNIYGDETRIVVPYGAVKDALEPGLEAGFGPFIPGGHATDSAYIVNTLGVLRSLDIRRTGYTEDRLLDNHNASTIKGDVGVYWKPFKDKSYEFSYNYRIGFGNSVYQGSERYALRSFTQQFHKGEIKGKDFFIRSYVSQTHDGDSYNMTALGAYTNETISPSAAQWVPTYLSNYTKELFLRTLTLYGGNPNSLQDSDYVIAHQIARMIADAPATALGDTGVNRIIEQVRNGLFQHGGAGFIDNSRLFHTEGLLDLSRWTGKWIDIQVGGNHRMYSLSTNGTVFNEDPDGTGTFKRINIQEYGAFLQLQRKLFKDVLRLQASVRIDKNQSFKAIWSPRVAAVLTFGKDRNHNIRMSYQTGFRNPDTQAQYIFFPTSSVLLGGTQSNAERYNLYNGGAYTFDSYNDFVASVAAGSGDISLLKDADFDFIKPENLQVVEVGYKAILAKKLLIDLNGYFNIYKDFITQITVVSKNGTYHQGNYLPGVSDVLAKTVRSPTQWRPYVNIAGNTYSWGAGLGLTYMLPKGYQAKASYNYMDFSSQTADASVLGFNASNHQMYVGISNSNVWKNMGFAIDYRWQSSIAWSSDFADGTVKARGMLDANVSFGIPKAMTTIKIGATNIAGPTYRTNVGGPFIGRTFFVSLTYDQFAKFKK